ncbi:disintegrin and metalloproteinase domain-containing protein 8 isoform X3 [Gallus gallus]|uniref:disintegrin and metalloproteinase domain-containing protein 8 isoform X3 n=1 Tax=Gallus gallus TaxID=9031 RepID=UPI001AE5851B|nr:disintegrin and metalloproteinase domain-containing protein 8 isoform X3 [Gallus gallus]
MAPPLAVLRLLLGLLLGRGVGAGLREELAHVERYETTVPRRVPSPRAKRDLSVSTSTYPERVLYSVCAEGRDYLLHLEKNRELLGQRYTETHYLADGTEVTVKPDVQDHCFYQGHVEGHANSAASISTCSGLSGFFRVNETVFLLKPLDEHEAGQHAVYRASHLRMKRSACLEAALEYDHDPKIAAPLKLYRWKSARLHRGPRYVELVLVVDNEEFRKYKDLRRVQNRMKEIVNHVDKLYQSLGLRVALIGLEVWSNRDKITVSRKAEETLENFLRWREMDLLKRKQHDNVQLITGIDFHDTTVGLAKKLAMCTRDSGGVNQDHSVDPIGAASTLAHEMGHNLGMSHDEDIADCHCPVSKERGGCVMAAKISSAYPRLFSTCSEQDMWQFLEDPKTSCLLNVPGADELYGEPVCGNQFVERGEECDCGRPEECSDRCCNATTCRLREGAECARGDCCQDCKVKAAGVLCRASKNDCDLPERCTGLSSECPEDVFQENGIPCQGGRGYCYNGACPSHAEQCRLLWGAAAQVAPDECFKHNSNQDRNFHCMTESGRRPCSPKGQQHGPGSRAGCAGAVQYPDRWRLCAAQRQGEEVLPEREDFQQTYHWPHQPALSGRHPATPAVPPRHRQSQPAQYYGSPTRCSAPCAGLPASAGEAKATHQASAGSENQAGSCHLSQALQYGSRRSAATNSTCQAPGTLIPATCHPGPAPARCPPQVGPEATSKQEVMQDSRAVGPGTLAGWQRTTEHHRYLNCSLDSTHVYRHFCALMDLVAL